MKYFYLQKNVIVERTPDTSIIKWKSEILTFYFKRGKKIEKNELVCKHKSAGIKCVKNLNYKYTLDREFSAEYYNMRYRRRRNVGMSLSRNNKTKYKKCMLCTKLLMKR